MNFRDAVQTHGRTRRRTTWKHNSFAKKDQT